MDHCGKCNGTGRVSPNRSGDDTCFCCSGKGHRGESDHIRCVSYVERHPAHTYFCVEQGYIDPMYVV